MTAMNEKFGEQRPSREREIFLEALDRRAGPERQAYLDAACAGDNALRQQMESMLAAHERDGAFLEQPAVAGAPELLALGAGAAPDPGPDAVTTVVVPILEKVGDRIGRYKLLQQIGEGGCGVVYLAEQEEPVRRQVAFKVIKLGMDTKDVIARFEAERQALALMDHPNIAKVFDGGATDTGRPYFVMELVRGVRITEYCDQHNLPTSQRLQLFIQVCHAIQHAHQKGIIHRDIKPSNVLVNLHDDVPAPKVIDFGIAKAIGERLTDKTVFTRFDQVVGTPAYMSPEQAGLSSLDIDTRSDIYALGVLLYELLTGRTPFDARALLQAGLEEMLRCIRETEPPKPSTRLSKLQREELTTTAQRRQTEPPRLLYQVRGDLDWIVMKCLEKNRARRYETANGLAADIERHLKHEPVSAGAPGALYQCRKFIRRNRAVLATASALVLLLAGGVVVSTWQAVRARRAERTQSQLRRQAEGEKLKAQTEAAKSQQVAQFLQDMLKGVGPSVALGRDTKMLREILDKTAERVSKDLTNQPEVQIKLLDTLGKVYSELGAYQKAEDMFRLTLARAQDLHGKEHPATATALNNVARMLYERGKLDEAETASREALSMNMALKHPAVAASLDNLAEVLLRRGKLAEAETCSRKALAMLEEPFGPEHLEVATSLNNLSGVLQAQGKSAEVETLRRRALAIFRKCLGDEHPTVATSMHNLAAILEHRDQLAEAEKLYRQTVDLRQKLLGPEHPELASSLNNLGWVLQRRGKLAESEKLHREALAMREKLLGREHLSVAASLDDLGWVLQAQNRLSEAEPLLRQALAMRKKLLVPPHADVAESLSRLGSVRQRQKDLAEAETLLREALDMRKTLFGAVHPGVASSLNKLARVLREQDKLEEAEIRYRQALEAFEKLHGPEHANVGGTLNNLAVVLVQRGKLAEAEDCSRKALDIGKKIFGPKHPNVANALISLGSVLEQQGKLAEAESAHRDALAMFHEQFPDDHPSVVALLDHLASVCQKEGKLAEAEPLLRRSLAVYEANQPGRTATFDAQSTLGAVLLGQKKYAEAEPLLLRGYQGLKQRQAERPAGARTPASAQILHQTATCLVQLYEATSQPEKTAEWRAKLAEIEKVQSGQKQSNPRSERAK
jgi:eukaryotic-like serine/threonine-protein kinase